MQSMQLSSEELKCLQLRTINTFACSVCHEKEYTPSFISFVSPITDPMLCALYFSVNGTVYSKGCYALPITASLQVKINYPTVVLNDGTNKYRIRFDAMNILLDFERKLTEKITEMVKNSDKITSKMIYSAFYNNNAAEKLVSKLPVPVTKNLFKTTFRLSSKQGKVDNPIAISMLLQQENAFRNFVEKKVHVVTWNIDQKMPPENLAPILGDAASKKYEIFVFCLQEIDMSMDAIMHGDSPIKKKAWDDALLAELNKNETYSMIGSCQLGTAYISVFVFGTPDLIEKDKVKNVKTSTISLGSMGFFNKSAVAIRFCYMDTNLCFICSHLSHGRKNVERRNHEFWIIQNGLKFNLDDGEVLSVDDHDAIIWSGDFNYRLTISDPESRAKFEETQYLFEHDQLNLAHSKNKVFVGYTEGDINFRPTYKFDKGTNTLDTSSKQRGPAWCDRIFLRMPGESQFVSRLNYDSVKGMLMSDHHPVYCDFHVKFWKNIPEKAAALYEEAKAKADKLKWRTSISQDYINFDCVKLGEQKSVTISLRNEGQMPVIFAIQCNVPWINVHPQRATVLPEKEIELIVSVLIDQTTQITDPILTSEFFQQIKIVYPTGKPPNFIFVVGKYDLTPIGMPLEYLSRLPAALSTLPASLFIPKREGDITSAPIMSFPLCTSGFYEINALIDSIRKTCKDPQFLSKTGQSEEMLCIIEALRCRKDLSECDFSEYGLVGVLLGIIETSPQPYLTAEFLKNWNQKECPNATTYLSTLPSSQRSTICLVTGFLLESIRRFPHDTNVNNVIRIFASAMTKNNRSVNEIAEQLISSLLN